MSTRPLGELIAYLRGITFKPEEKVEPRSNGSVVCMRTKNIQATLDESDLIAVPASLVRREELLLRKDDILLSSANSWNLVGKCCRVPELGYAATAGGFISVIRPTRGVDAAYLYHWLSSGPVQERVRGCARQTTNIANLSVPQFERLEVPVPPLAEQRRIADILDKADDVRRKRAQAVAHVDELLRATFLDMFGDPVTNPRGWPISSVLDLCASTQYGTAQKANEDGRGLPVLRMNNITYEGRVDLTDLKWVELKGREREKLDLRDGDILFNRTNSRELVGKTAVWKHGSGYTFAGYLIRLRVKEMALGDYVAAALNTPSGKRLLSTTAKPSINMANISGSDLGRLPIAVPPLELQKHYRAYAERIFDHRKRHELALLEASSLFDSLVQRAFTGELTSSRPSTRPPVQTSLFAEGV